jgi:four helix bundle protein
VETQTTSPMLTSYRDLDAWKQSLALVVDVYRVTGKLPAAERFGLTAQMRRAAVSVSCNIAEGYGRATRGEYLNHLSMARGSVNEVEALCEVCQALDLLGAADLAPIREQLTKVRQLLGRLREALRKRPELKSRKPR